MSDDANLFVFYRTDDLEAAQNAAFLVDGLRSSHLSLAVLEIQLCSLCPTTWHERTDRPD